MTAAEAFPGRGGIEDARRVSHHEPVGLSRTGFFLRRLVFEVRQQTFINPATRALDACMNVWSGDRCTCPRHLANHRAVLIGAPVASKFLQLECSIRATEEPQITGCASIEV